MPVLVGDIGGTHCRLALASHHETGIRLHDIRRYRNADHAGLADILAAYLGPSPATTHACLAVAGPTDGQQVRFTNLDWQIDCRVLRTRLALAHIHLINDFEAVGWGLNALQPSDRVMLQNGQNHDAEPGVKAAIGAGTGLGVSICVPSPTCHRPLPTEGGHIGFAPVDAEQDRLLAFMRERHGRVSVERLLSGPGITDLYRFCLREHGEPETHAPLLAAEGLAANTTAQAISTAALAGEHAPAVQAMRLFVRVYGQVAGDIALVSLARGGVFLAGGIAPQILPLFNAPDFLNAFHAKGRYREWMRTLPIAVITDTDIGLKGAAVAAGSVAAAAINTAH